MKITTPSDVLNAVIAITGVSLGEFVSSSRHKEIVAARELYAAAARLFTRASWPEISMAACRSHHSTLHLAYGRFHGRPDADAMLEQVEERLNQTCISRRASR